ncbi:hypothetical protein M413DRAFT_29090 [Hebeloma cylindrosporum]|uniref:F-box domain-containing protein n=1 Tax=Hebeloma cylindrosporum TaxID=76867 RepID=A0A0C3C8L2_HEBCY|nr:hypothetical protein M413DRAFT_29090 [Hebeloma cylindrosporum h7]
MIDVPPEIWLQIAHFIPDELLGTPQLMAVCRTFFELRLDARWNNVVILTSGVHHPTKLLERISEPIITRRVRRLMLFLHLEEQAFHSRGYKKPLPRFWRKFVHAFHDLSKELRRSPVAPRKIRTFDDVLDAILALSPNFSALQELMVDCWNLPSSPLLSKFLTNLWVPIQANLRILSFGGNLHEYRILIESKPDFQALKELQIDFNSRNRITQQFSDRVTLLEVVVPFVQALKPQLESLRVSSSATLEFSAFFTQLGPFPALDVLDIHRYYNFCPIQAETLQHAVTLKPFTLQIISNRRLVQCFMDSQCLSHLQTLTIEEGAATGLKVIQRFIQRASVTLEEICIETRYLQISEAITIIKALSLCPNLISLKMNATQLTVQLLNLLASHLPRLRRLSISCQERRRSGWLYDYSFFYVLKNYSHIHWALKDLSLYGPSSSQPFDNETMHTIALQIPSLDSFFGRGHMNLP